MVCRFIFGRAGSGKTHYCLQKLAEAQRQPLDDPILLLVPVQSTFITEKALAAEFSQPGFCRGQITSFRRLAYRAKEMRPALKTGHLSETARKMLLGKILRDRQGDLRFFSTAMRQVGFTATLLQALTELKIYDIGPADLQNILVNGKNLSPSLADKLADLSLIYGDFRQLCGSDYADSEDDLTFLAETIEKDGFLAGSHILIDGFSDFTPRESQVIAALMKQAAKVEIALTLDQEAAGPSLHEADLFYTLAKTRQKLLDLGQKAGVAWEEPLFLAGDQGRFVHNDELAFIEREFFPITGTDVWSEKPKHITLTSALNPRQEIAGIARQILSLVRDEGLRYRDISIIARDITPYKQLLEEVFTDLHIPFFVDMKKTLLYDPLIELLRAALDVVVEGWHYGPLFRYFKNPLAPLSLTEADELENYCLAAGIRHYHWLSDKDWNYYPQALVAADLDGQQKEQALQELNDLRRQGAAALSKLCRVLSGMPSLADVADALTQFLYELQVPQKLQQWQEDALAEGDAEQASVYKQVWQKVTDLLREVKDFLAEERWPAEDICAVFDAALSAMQLSVVPPGLDEVFVASLDRSRNPDIKVAFVLGANEGKLPAKIMQDGLFSTQDRLDLAEAGLDLAPAANSRQLEENYLLYVALTRAKEKLCLSYCLQDEAGQEEKPSLAVERLRQLFPHLTTQMYGRDEGLNSVTGGIGTVAELAKQLSAQTAGQNMPAYWRDVYNYYMKNDEMRELMQTVMQGLRFAPPQHRLQRRHIEHLFGKNLRSSVSRLEKFRACPLSYFATYSLKLHKRPVYELNALDRGQLFHEVLSVIGQRIEAEKIDWREIDEAKAERLVDEAMQPLLPRFLGNILASNARYAYLAQRIKNTLKITLLLWAQHMKKGSFRPIAWEIKFGGDGVLPALKIPLADGRCLEIHGQIDRVDMAVGEEKTWFRVVDYKTGQQSVSVRDIFQGLKLQLLLYLQLVLDNSSYFRVPEQAAAGAGLYYSFVRDDMSNISLSDLAKEEERNLCGLRLAGISVKDAEAVLLADQDCDGHSALIPVAMKADGSFWANSAGISSEQLSLLREHLLGILRQTASTMLEGLIAASPQGMGNFSTCSYCDYRDFCGFDLQLMTKKEQLQPVSEEDIWQSLSRGVSGDE